MRSEEAEVDDPTSVAMRLTVEHADRLVRIDCDDPQGGIEVILPNTEVEELFVRRGWSQWSSNASSRIDPCPKPLRNRRCFAQARRSTHRFRGRIGAGSRADGSDPRREREERRAPHRTLPRGRRSPLTHRPPVDGVGSWTVDRAKHSSSEVCQAVECGAGKFPLSRRSVLREPA